MLLAFQPLNEQRRHGEMRQARKLAFAVQPITTDLLALAVKCYQLRERVFRPHHSSDGLAKPSSRAARHNSHRRRAEAHQFSKPLSQLRAVVKPFTLHV